MAGLTEVSAVRLGDCALRFEVGEQRGLDPELIAERLVGEGRVDTDPDQGDAGVVQLGLELFVERQLVGADRAEIERVEGEQHSPAGEVGKGNLLAGVVRKGEIRSLGPDFDQRRRPRSATRAR